MITEPMPSVPTTCGTTRPRALPQLLLLGLLGVRRHADWIETTSRATPISVGHSDSTINCEGIRMGAGQISAAILEFYEITDALVLGGQSRRRGLAPLFVVFAQQAELDNELTRRIARRSARTAAPATLPTRYSRCPACRAPSPASPLEVPVKPGSGNTVRRSRQPRLARQRRPGLVCRRTATRTKRN
jgi:acetoacetyl-CoA synthetase